MQGTSQLDYSEKYESRRYHRRSNRDILEHLTQLSGHLIG